MNERVVRVGHHQHGGARAEFVPPRGAATIDASGAPDLEVVDVPKRQDGPVVLTFRRGVAAGAAIRNHVPVDLQVG